MSERTIIGRIIQKHDVEANWVKATNFIPKKGEIIVYDKDASYGYERMKIGDGMTNINNLLFIDDPIRSLIESIRRNEITNAESPLILVNNTEYYLTNVSLLEIIYPEQNFEVWMNISFASTGTINMTFPVETQYIGAAPTFGNNETWEISIKNGVVICWRIE